MLLPLIVILGLVFGSFLTAFVTRYQAGKNWLNDRSECDSCHKTLAPQDLVPLISWLAARGRCRQCRKPISWTYPATEVATALVFGISYLAWPEPHEGVEVARFVIWLATLVGLMALSIYDLRWMLLPNRLMIPVFALAIASILVRAILGEGGPELIRDAVLGMIIGGGIFMAIFYTSGGKWIGGGDVKLGLLLGLIVAGPFESIFMIMLASAMGLLVTLPLISFKVIGPKTPVPFGPILIASAYFVVLFGEQMIGWYANDFLNFSITTMLNL